MASGAALIAREAEESHRGHASGAEHHAEDLEIHRLAR